MIDIFPHGVLRIGPLIITDTVVVSLLVSVILVVGGLLAIAFSRSRRVLEIIYDVLETSVQNMVEHDVRSLVPLILTQWLFIGISNLIGLIPGLYSPTRDLSVAVALALVAFLAGHIYAFRQRGLSYLRHYAEPNLFLLPFNVIGEVSRTIALALRLFGNMLSGALIGAIAVYLAGLFVPIPLMLLGVLTALVQAYIFGILTLVFAASSAEIAQRGTDAQRGQEKAT